MAKLTDTQRLVLAAAVHATTGHPMPKGTEDLSPVHNEVESLVGAFVNEVARQHVTAALEEAAARIEGAPDFTFKRNLDRVRAADIIYRYRNEVRGYRQEQDRG
mgnify:CR=1 FL=1